MYSQEHESSFDQPFKYDVTKLERIAEILKNPENKEVLGDIHNQIYKFNRDDGDQKLQRVLNDIAQANGSFGLIFKDSSNQETKYNLSIFRIDPSSQNVLRNDYYSIDSFPLDRFDQKKLVSYIKNKDKLVWLWRLVLSLSVSYIPWKIIGYNSIFIFN